MYKEYVLKNKHCEIHTTTIVPLTSTYEQRHVPTQFFLHKTVQRANICLYFKFLGICNSHLCGSCIPEN